MFDVKSSKEEKCKAEELFELLCAYKDNELVGEDVFFNEIYDALESCEEKTNELGSPLRYFTDFITDCHCEVDMNKRTVLMWYLHTFKHIEPSWTDKFCLQIVIVDENTVEMTYWREDYL